MLKLEATVVGSFWSRMLEGFKSNVNCDSYLSQCSGTISFLKLDDCWKCCGTVICLNVDVHFSDVQVVHLGGVNM